jgi:signal transduction histidine kinase
MVEPPASGADLRARLTAEQRKLTAVRELGKALGANLDLDHILTTIVHKVPELLDAERATLYLLRQRAGQGAELVSKVVMGGPAPPLFQEIRLSLGVGIAGSVAQSGEPLNIPDAYKDPRFNPEVDRRSGFHTRSILCVPIPDHSGHITGVLQALNRRDGGAFDADDEALLGAVAAYAGVALENSKLYQSLLMQNAELLRAQRDLRQRVDELDLLFQIERESSAAMDLPALICSLGRRAVPLLHAEAGLIALRQPSGELETTAFSSSGAGEVLRVRLPHGDAEGVLGKVVRGGVRVLSNDAALEGLDLGPRVAALLGLPVRQVLAVPLDHGEAHVDGHDDGHALGAIAVINKQPEGSPFSEEDAKLLTLLSGHAARAIVLSRTRALRTRESNLASIGRMLAGVMHDLRTPMTIASGYAQLMVTSDDQAERERFAGMISKQFQLMESMTGEVMAFARGESRLLIRRVLMNRFVEELREQLLREIPSGIELKLEARYLGAAYFDELKVLRLIHNLARNAVQAMPHGGLFHVTIDVLPELPGSGAGQGGPQRLVFTFTDTGGGLPEEVQAHLFEAFVSANKDGGTGLGLAIVKKIVDDHHGRISVSTHRGEGTTFTVTIPLSRE